MLKLAGIIIMLICSLILGEYLGIKGELRMERLSEIRRGISFLWGDLSFSLRPLKDSARLASEKLKAPSSNILGYFSELLSEGIEADKAWETALDRFSFECYFTSEDIEVLKSVGQILSFLDIKKQEDSIGSIFSYIDQKTAFLRGENIKTKRLYRSFSVLGGLLLAVILL